MEGGWHGEMWNAECWEASSQLLGCGSWCAWTIEVMNVAGM